MIYPEVKYRHSIIEYYCPVCKVELAWQHEYNGGKVKSECSHFEWRSYGNLYYELNIHKLNKDAMLRIFDGTSVYILYPKSQ